MATLTGFDWSVIDLEIPDKDAAEAARRLTRLLLLAMLGERLYEQEVGTGGDDKALLADLAWAADSYAFKAAAHVAEPEPAGDGTDAAKLRLLKGGA